MSGIFIIIIIIVSVMLFVVFEVLVSMGTAGFNPSKFISAIFNKTEHNKQKSKNEINKMESVEKEFLYVNKSESNDPTQLSEEIKRWRLIAGISFGLLMVFLLVFYRPRAMSGLYAFASYAFWPLVIANVIVFIILQQKEKKHKK